ncbi:hypothetical protein J7438_19385 [Thalassotalea sp. G20_0]|uniref:hypothetical protein n=1 Tax=Thalassotalea sp. G20_0 TaxID=2821093 RepID=UPI001ADB06A5|nr:hypothetical protein [Thalassotalea sp. G20_0]MBO9496223.1 hypothetical protein [Thalassotalea sp. G20_0]
MHGVNSGDVSRNTYNPQQENKSQKMDTKVSQGESGTTNPIAHRTCISAEGVAASSSAQAASPLSDAPTVHLTKTFYHPKDKEPLIFPEKHLMTHGDFRDILSKHMDVYAVVTDGRHGHGAINILAIGKPKFKLNDLKGKFHTCVFQSIPSLKETPYSSDLIGISLNPICRIVDKFYINLEKKNGNNHETMSLIERSVFNKLKPKYNLEFNSIPHIVTHKDFLKDISPEEARFILEKTFDASIEQMKEQLSTHNENELNSKATINDLPEILRSYKDRMSWGSYDSWKLNYLDEALLNNAKWE